MSISKYFVDNRYENIVIYGLGELGILLYESLHKCNLHVLYGIDQGNPNVPKDLICYKLDDIKELDSPDVIVITVPHLFMQIKSEITNMYSCNIVSLADVLA